MKQIHFYLFLCFSFSVFLAFGQQKSSKTSQDSLKTVLDRQSADMFIGLSSDLKFTQREEATTHAKNAYTLSKRIDYKEGIISSAYLLGIYARDAKNYRRAARLVSEGVEAARSTGNQTVALRGLDLLQEIYRLDKRKKKLAETEIEYKKLKDILDLNKKASQLSVLKKDFSSKEKALRRSEAEKRSIQDILDQTLEERLREEADLAKLAQEKAELELKTLQMENESAQNALEISEKEKELFAFNARLKRQQLWQVILLVGLGVAILFIVLLIRYYQLKRASEADQLKARQQLEMQEKMATLGQLLAGIAHEIKNPLNFVNNFAVGSSGIVEEIEEWMLELSGKPDHEDLKYLEELVSELKQNAVDIHSNGQRINRIVNSMMEHARDRNGERTSIDINGLVRENLNLAYLGYRALKPSFKATLEESYDPELMLLEGVSQDLGRVFLNIFNNACYALHQKQQDSDEQDISFLKVETKAEEEKAVILIWDNGPGILPENREKIFTPFFTTKPTGDGNAGLGLSISYDIIVQGHQGTIDVNSEPGVFTEFVIRLPLQNDKEPENKIQR